MRLAYSLDLKSDIRTITGWGANAAAMVATPSATRWTKNSRGLAYAATAAATCSRTVAGQVSRSSSALGWMPICRLMMNSSRASPTPALRQPGERERLVRGADVHHDLRPESPASVLQSVSSTVKSSRPA